MSNKLIDELLDRANIVDVIGQFIKLHKSGANYFGLCPFHHDNHASLSVSPKKRIFKCFSCGTSGNVINFVQKYKKISYGQAIKEVAKLLGYSDQQIDDYFFKSNKSLQINSKLYSLNAEANEIFKSLLFNTENKKYLQYLLDRKLSLSTIKKFEIGFCGKNNSSQIMYDLLTNKEINSNAK
jgi:DNA primase